MNKALTTIAISASLGFASLAHAELTVQVHEASEQGPAALLGTVTVTESEYGLVFTPDLKGFEPGIHGFHIHENPSCDALKDGGAVTPAGAAGGHYDPQTTGRHDFPWGTGHLGDLPALYVDANGNATTPVLAPRLENLSDIDGRALMVHEGGDNYSDHPKRLGGGGARVACGVISQ